MRRSSLAVFSFIVILAGTSSAHAAAPALVLDYPKGGETFVVGTTQVIRVNPKTKVTPITFALSRNGPQGTFITIGTVTPSKTTPPNFSFVVSGPGSGNCVIRISGQVKGKDVTPAFSGVFQIVTFTDVGGGAADITTNNLTVNGAATVSSAGITDYGNLSVSGDTVLTGNVGVGTAFPGAKVDIAGKLRTSYDDPLGMIVKGTGDNNNPAQIEFDKSVVDPSHSSAIGYAPDRGHFTLVNGIDRMNILPNGNVGIGTKTPASKLSVNGSADFSGSVGIGAPPPGIPFCVTNTSGSFRVHPIFGVANGTTLLAECQSATTDGPQLRFGNTTPNFIDIGQDSTSNFVIETSDQPRLTILQNGNVGIGTTTPASTLSVAGSADFSGNVGIGTATPQHKLDVNGNIFMGQQQSGAVFTTIGDTLYLGSQRKYLSNSLGAPVNGTLDWINLMCHPFSAGIMFGVSGPTNADPHSVPTPRMVIQSGGNVGIGVTNPQTPLEVNNALRLRGPGGGGATVRIDLATYDTVAALKVNPAAQILATDDGASSASVDILTKTPGDPNDTLNSRIHITNFGLVGIGTTNPGAALDVRGDVKLGNAGELFAASGDENLRMLRGAAGQDGNPTAGAGFVVQPLGNGNYLVIFLTPFADVPTVTASITIPFFGASVAVLSQGPQQVQIQLSLNGNPANLPFNFIAVGAR